MGEAVRALLRSRRPSAIADARKQQKNKMGKNTKQQQKEDRDGEEEAQEEEVTRRQPGRRGRAVQTPCVRSTPSDDLLSGLAAAGDGAPRYPSRAPSSAAPPF